MPIIEHRYQLSTSHTNVIYELSTIRKTSLPRNHGKYYKEFHTSHAIHRCTGFITTYRYSGYMLHKQQRMYKKVLHSGLFSWVKIFVKKWKRFPELNFVVLIFVAWLPYAGNVNFELGTCGESFAVDENRRNTLVSSLAWKASLASQTQPTPARITFRLLKLSVLGVVGSGLLKAVQAGVWLARLREKLPRLQRHLGG